MDSDLLGQSYEYLIKHFADLTNKKAGEFYTPRSVVHLLGLILDPHEGETIYDPACGIGGMLLECVDHPERQQRRGLPDPEIVRPGKEPDLPPIARMNMFCCTASKIFRSCAATPSAIRHFLKPMV